MSGSRWPILILPGIHGSSDAHWQTTWERSLPGARRVHASDWARPVRADWVAALEQAVAAAEAELGARSDAGVVLVAHSLGCHQVVHWATETWRRTVRGALLVAPPDPAGAHFPPQAVGFDRFPETPLPFPSTVVASSDDPYAGLSFSRHVAAAWGSRFVDVGCAGHLNADSGLGGWEAGRDALAELLQRRGPPADDP